MYQVNLLPWRLRRQRQRYRFWLRCFCAQLAFALVALAAIHGALSYQQAQLRQALQRLAQQYAGLNAQFEQRRQGVAALARLTAEYARRQQNQGHNQRYLALLLQLSQALPATLWLTELEQDAQGIRLQGLGEHYRAIAGFEQRLAALPLLQGCRLAEVTQRQDGILAFTLTARWGHGG